MRILVLAPHPFLQNRGTPLAVKAVVEFLTGRGHAVDVLTFPEGTNPGIPGCTVHRVPQLPGIRNVRPGFSFRKVVYDLLLTRAAHRLLRRQRYDLVHAVEESAFIAMVLRRRFAVPFIYDMDSSMPRQIVERWPWVRIVARPMEAAERRAIRASTAVLTVCRALEDHARHLVPTATIGRVEDTSLITDGSAQPPPDDLPGGRDLALYVGNLEPYQGIDLLLQAFRLAAPEAPDLDLVLVGGAPRHVDKYRRYAEHLGVGPRVHVLGPRPPARLGTYLRRADILVSPRLSGVNTPMKLYSYLDSGRPVLATALPTHEQVLDDSVARLVSPIPEALAEGLVALARDPETRDRLGAAGRERYLREYGPTAFDRKMTAFYDGVFAQIAVGPTGRPS